MNLRKVRIISAWIVFSIFLLTFLGGTQLSIILAPNVLRFQFTPSFILFLTLGILSLNFLIILAITLVFGRLYCASLCPLGILQDIISFFSKKFTKRKSYPYQKAYPLLRNIILYLTLILGLSGSFTLINLLDPYSQFGRILSNIVKPVIIGISNLIVPLFESFDIYLLSISHIHPITLSILFIDIILIIILIITASTYGRLFCNTICPVGTFLGFFSRYSLFRVMIRKNDCISCSICEQECRAGCIDHVNTSIDLSRCVTCFDCISACPESAIRYQRYIPRTSHPKHDRSKRGFLFTSFTTLASILATYTWIRPYRSIYALPRSPITPPGSVSYEHFTQNCTACALCINTCPTHVLKGALFEFGLSGLMQPTLDFKRGYCDYTCTACIDVCPTEALQPISLDEKKLTQIGKAKLNLEKCVVETKRKDCGACAEVCPTHAVYTVKKYNLNYPQMKEKHCIGCGHCENVCPTNPRAIAVSRNKVHRLAKKPYYTTPMTNEAVVLEDQEDFPF